jgi:MFS family permease
MSRDATEELLRGWKVLLASGVGIAAGLSGIAFYTFGVFIVPLSDEFGWSRGQLSIAASFMIIGTAITAPVVGTVIDRYGTRMVSIASMILLGIGYFCLTQLNGNLYTFYGAWLLIALIGGGTTPVVWTCTISMWFDRMRGLALGVTLAGSGIIGIFGPALVTTLIEHYGWEGGYIGIGCIILFFSLPIVFIFSKDGGPESQSSIPAGPSPTKQELTGKTLPEAFRSQQFWIIAGGFFLVSGVIAGLLINMVPMLIDKGLNSSDAAQIAGFLGVAVVIGRIGIGFVIDRAHAPVVARTLLLITAAGCWLLTIDGTPIWVIVISVMGMGLAAAAEVDLVAFLTSRYLGMKAYGKIYGFQTSAFYLGAALGPIAVGLAYDHFQSYRLILNYSAAILVFGGLVVGSLGMPPNFNNQPEK